MRWERGRTLHLLVVLAFSFAVTSYIVLRNTSTECGDLLGGNSDHLRDAHATWLFFHRGFALYRKPLSDVAQNSTFRHPVAPWGDANWAYPPGLFALFLPMTAVGQWTTATLAQFGRWLVVYLLFFSHLALFAWVRLVRHDPLWTLWCVLGFCIFVQLGFQGFHDQAWMACGIMAAIAARRHQPARGLAWLSAAALISYRAVALTPLGIVLAHRHLRHPGTSLRRWGAFVLPLLAGAIDLYTFALFMNHVPGTRSRFAQFMQSNVHLHPTAPLDWAVLGATLLGLTILLVLRARLVAAALLLGHIVAVLHGVMWWHASVLFPAAIATALPPLQHRSRVSAAVMVWMLVVALLVFSYQPLHILNDMVAKWPT